ncbi:25002_t:CDS:1, partial [Gigaspora margarita]
VQPQINNGQPQRLNINIVQQLPRLQNNENRFSNTFIIQQYSDLIYGTNPFTSMQCPCPPQQDTQFSTSLFSGNSFT